MKIPSQIKIFGYCYDVEVVDVLPSDNYGIIDFDDLKIRIRDTKQKEEVFIHEVLHGVLQACRNYKANDDELLVDMIANGIYTVIMDNPILFEKKENPS